MAPGARAVDDKIGVRGDKTAVAEFLTLLARAIQQLHTYPPTSPLCVSAIEACGRVLAALDGLSFRVTPSALIVDEVPIGRGTQIEHELARRLHKASVASVSIDRAASARELSRFCGDLVRCGSRDAGDVTLLEMLTEHGVDQIAVEMASRPEVLDIGAAPSPLEEAVVQERNRFEAQLAKGGGVNHLYPPQKGWVRLDPASNVPAVSLVGLALLADDPAVLARMLLQLTDDGAADIAPEAALQQKYSDVAMLFSAMDPRIARRMFAKLARAVLDLGTENRQALLRRTILPGLLDGRVDGAVLRDFPDVDLAESLCLLLDLETAAPELLSTALSRLELSAERHAAMVPLLESRLQEREAAAAAAGQQTSLAKHARELVRVDGAGKDFGEFAAFDLSLDDEAAKALVHMRTAVPASDVLRDQLACLWRLTCLEPNPDLVRGFVDRAFRLLDTLEQCGRGAELAPWLASYRDLAERVREPRPDVADVINAKLAAFCTPERVAWIADLSGREPGGREAADAIVEALGTAVVGPLVQLVEPGAGPAAQARSKAAAQILGNHAARLAPSIVTLLPGATVVVRRTLVRVLGLAGPGYEGVVAAQIDSGDEQTARESLRSLARIGTPQAGALVAAEVGRQRGALSVAAEETLWRFPAAEAMRHVRDLLAKREFAMRHPEAAERLLDRAARGGATGLEPALAALAPMRYRIWNPALARVARKARLMLNR